MAKEILVVEDNRQNLELVEFLLEEAGHTIRAATDADELRTQVDQKVPDLVLMDIQLPGVDGLTLVAELRGRRATQDVKIIALTAHAMRGDRERFLEAGCDGYISKPVDIATFVGQVEEYL